MAERKRRASDMNLIQRIEVLFPKDRVGDHGSIWFKPAGSDHSELEKARRHKLDLQQQRAFKEALTKPLKRGIEVFDQPIEEL